MAIILVNVILCSYSKKRKENDYSKLAPLEVKGIVGLN